MAQSRDSKGRFKSGRDGLLGGLGSKSLSELVGLRDFYNRNWKEANRAARAKGGAGTNRLDEQAREFASKQRSVVNEIFSRLTSIHLGRSKKARIADESKQAEVTYDPRKWVRNKSRYDYPGVDTKDE